MAPSSQVQSQTITDTDSEVHVQVFHKNIEHQRTLDYAERYIDEGIPVFQLKAGDKKPYLTGGFHNATLEKDIVERWFTNSSYNIGIATGAAGLVVIDVDRKPEKDGAKNFEDWLVGRVLPETLTVRTRSGGLHYYFRGMGIKSAQNKPCIGVDIRADGGYVVAPPSYVEADDKGPAGYYEFINDLPIADLPDWLAKELASKKPLEKPTAQRIEWAVQSCPIEIFPETKSNGLKLLQCVVARIARGVDCSTESEWFNLLLEFRSLVYQCGWSDDKAWFVFDKACQNLIGGNYDFDKNRRRWERDDFNPEGRTYKSLLYELRDTNTALLPTGSVAVPPTKKFQPLSIRELQNQPSPKWLIRNILSQNGIGSIYGPSGSGKSFVVLDMLMSIARGSDWFGFRVKEPMPVIYVALEGSAGIKHRIAAYLKHNEIDEPENFYVLLVSFDIRREVKEFLESVKPVDPAIVVIDTLAQSAPGMDENQNAEMSLVLSSAKAIAETINGLCLFVHHVGKDAGRGPRGHSSFMAALDIAIEVTPETSQNPRGWRIAKSKDGRDDLRGDFKLHIVQLGFDEEDEAITSCVIERDTSAVFKDTSAASKRGPTGKNQITALNCLRELCPISRTSAVDKIKVALGTNTRKTRADEALDGLISGGFIIQSGENLYLPNHAEIAERLPNAVSAHVPKNLPKLLPL